MLHGCTSDVRYDAKSHPSTKVVKLSSSILAMDTLITSQNTILGDSLLEPKLYYRHQWGESNIHAISHNGKLWKSKGICQPVESKPH